MQTYQVTNIAEFFNAVLSATNRFSNDRLWWRGQERKDWGVIPSLYHKGKSKQEANMNIRFKNLAKIRHLNTPDPNESDSWLFLMRHYELPTRLLDWTESPLVGLFFAVREVSNLQYDAALWGISPSLLNKAEMGKKLIFGASSKETQPLFQDAFKLDSKHDNRKALAITSTHFDVRQMIQLSEFTIHGSPHPLNEHSKSDEFMVCLVIPAAAKKGIQQSLALLRISESNLFPDLEHLAKELEMLEFDDHIRTEL